jgi:hypothetical protein
MVTRSRLTTTKTLMIVPFAGTDYLDRDAAGYGDRVGRGRRT